MFVFLFPDRSALEYLLSVFRPSAVCISPSRLTCRKEELHPILCKDKKIFRKSSAVRSQNSITSAPVRRFRAAPWPDGSCGHLFGQAQPHVAGRRTLLFEDRMVVVVAVERFGQFVGVSATIDGAKFAAAACTVAGYSVSALISSISSGRSAAASSWVRKSIPASSALRRTERMRACVYWMKGPVLPLKSIDSRGRTASSSWDRPSG